MFFEVVTDLLVSLLVCELLVNHFTKLIDLLDLSVIWTQQRCQMRLLVLVCKL